MTIASILKSKPSGATVVSVLPDETVLGAARVLTEHRIGATLVRDAEGALLGILSERDVIRGMAGHGQGTTTLPVSRFMTAELVTVTPAMTIEEALALMTHRRIRHLPVLEQGRLVGLVSIGDLVKARIDRAEFEAESLKAYVASAG